MRAGRQALTEQQHVVHHPLVRVGGNAYELQRALRQRHRGAQVCVLLAGGILGEDDGQMEGAISARLAARFAARF